MDAEDFDGIVTGLKDAIAHAKGERGRARIVAGPDVKAIRKRINLTQIEFARTYHIPVGTVRDWEQKRRHPDTGSTTLLKMIQVDPKGVEKIIAKM